LKKYTFIPTIGLWSSEACLDWNWHFLNHEFWTCPGVV